MDRTILHCDCNSFFASVETVAHPEYDKVPMAVCGSKEERHGIVLAKNELAKKCGIKTGEVIWQAKKKCPELLTVNPNYSLYSEYSKAVNKIYYEYTDMVEPFGIDESWLDVTASRRLFGDGKQIADMLRKRIKRELGITISVGVSFNKIFAKLGSDYKKPDATTVISRENYTDIVYPLKVSELLFIGKHTAEKLHILGIDTIGQLANTDAEFLEQSFGKVGKSLHVMASGKYESDVLVFGDRHFEKSIGNGYTFKRDIMNYDDAQNALTVICDEVGRRMRSAGVRARTVTVGMKDTNLSVFTRSKTLETYTCSSRFISDTAYKIILENWNMKKPLRSLTVTASDFISSDKAGEQLKLFYSENELYNEKNERLERTVDKIRCKYGMRAIVHGTQIQCGNMAQNEIFLLQ